MEPMLYETHTHTPLCRHATGEPWDYAAEAFGRGFAGMIVTDHNAMPDGFSAGVRMPPDEFDDYVRRVSAARDRWHGRVDVRLGLEADFFPGYEAWLERQLQAADFDYVLGSVHPQTDEYRERFWSDDPRAVQRDYFRLLAEAAETRLFDCLAHPDFIKNETPADWEPQRIMDDIGRALDRIAAVGGAMELNTSGVQKTIPEMNPFPAMLVEMRRRGIPVVIGSDAHQPERVGDGYLAALDLLEACGYSHASVFLRRRRHDQPIALLRARLKPAPESAVAIPRTDAQRAEAVLRPSA